MASIKTATIANEAGPRYHVTDAHGNHASVRQASVPSANAPSTSVLVIESGGNKMTLSQANAADLATVISNFGSTGVLT
jgi:Ni2+-binding GTPase involved in maturation of urease and hydrogenase